MTHIAMLGIGRMGRELATHIVNDGHQLTVWNRTAASTRPLVTLGAVAVGSPALAVEGADVVVTALFGPATVREVITATQVLPRGSTWVDITTIAPADAAENAMWAQDRDIAYAHAPVVGTLAPARARKLGTFLGGDVAGIAAARPIVELWTDPERLVVVNDPAAAATGKLLANLALGVSLQGLLEALRLGQGNGLDTDTILRMLRKTGLDFIATMKGDMIREQAFEDTQFSVDLLAKDARLMIASSPAPLPAVTNLLETLTRAQRADLGDYDISAALSGELPKKPTVDSRK